MSKEVLILLHGNGEDHTYFKNQMEAFSWYYEVHALDTRGHGDSPRGDGPFTIARFAEDLKQYIDDRKISRANILGFSDGGNIAMVFAMKYPQRVGRLILNGANLDPGGVKRSTQWPIEIGYRLASMGKSEKARRNAEMLGLMVNDPNIRPEQLKQIKARTLVIAGTKDVIRKDHTELIARSIPDAELVWIRGNHFIAAKNSEAFNEAVLKFLQEE